MLRKLPPRCPDEKSAYILRGCENQHCRVTYKDNLTSRGTWNGTWSGMDVVFKSRPYPTKKQSANKPRNELNILQQLQCVAPDASFYMRLVGISESDCCLVLILERGEETLLKRHISNIVNHRSCLLSQHMHALLFAVMQLHGFGFVHNNISPQNVVLCANGQGLALIDFAHAIRVNDCGHRKPTCEKNDDVLTSGLYSARIDFATHNLFQRDLFSLGITCFVLLTQKSPYPQNAAKDTKKSIKKSFENGTWMHTILLSPDVCADPLYECWCDLISGLCSGRWQKANQNLLAHTFPSAWKTSLPQCFGMALLDI